MVRMKYSRRLIFKTLTLTIVLFLIVLIGVRFSGKTFSNSDYHSMIPLKMFPSAENGKYIPVEEWKIPLWVERYNVSDLFDWTWYKNVYFRRCRSLISRLSQSSIFVHKPSLVVNDVLDYFNSHPDEGCIVDNVHRLPNVYPHPIPLSRSLSKTCSALNIDKQWILCRKNQSELDNWLPSTKRFVTIGVFNAFVDWGHCHSEVPGTIFTERATFHFQRWTNNECANDLIETIPLIQPENKHLELIDSIGTYLQAPGHFVPQQLPRLLRLLAVVPSTAKVLVAKGGIADSLIDILIERGIVTRDRIIQFDKNLRPNHFGLIVYRSESWPYLKDKTNSHYIHDRTDMQLVHRVMSNTKTINKKDRIIIIKRENGHPRSIIEHLDIIHLIQLTLNKSDISLDLHIEIFQAQGHITDHIDLFSRARIIVGPHGGGMINILWSSPGTHVIEVGYTTGMTFPEMYAEMSLHLEQHYWICRGIGDYSTPIHIDMDDFHFIFNKIIYQIQTEHRLSSFN